MSESGQPVDSGATTAIATGWRGNPGALVAHAFRAAVADAGAAATLGATELDRAVHEYRKALRRARAFLALLRPAIGRDAHDELSDELSAARRAVSLARDHTVAAAALAQLALESQEREGANHLLELLQSEEPPSDEILAALAAGAARARAQADALDTLLPDEVSLESLCQGSARTYRQAQQARKDAKRSRRAFHRFRRRCKELDAQLGLFTEHAGAQTAALREVYGNLSATLGPVADLIMLRSLSSAYRDRHPEAPFEDLETALAGLADEQIRAARRAAKPLFSASEKKLAKVLHRAIERDLRVPPRVQDDDPGDSDRDAD